MAKNILIIDDDQLVVKTLSRYLKTYGYKVETVMSGEEAVKKAEAMPFDLIISDVRMPGMNGLETLKNLRSVCQNKHKIKIPEIIITGYASDENHKEAEEMGITNYLYKPFDVSIFIHTVKQSLGE